MTSPAQPASFTYFGLFVLAWVLLFAFQYGFHISALNQISDVMTCRAPPGGLRNIQNHFGLPSCIPLTDAEFSAVTAFFTVGGLVGSLLGTPVTERRGRRGALVVDGILLTVGCALMALAPGMGLLLAGRFFIGVGAGIGVTVGPVFMGELAPPQIKGSVGVLFQVSIVFGILVTQLVGMVFAKPGLWRFVLSSSCLLSIVLLAIAPLVTESHAWLAGNGRTQEAERVRERLWTSSADSTSYQSVPRQSTPPPTYKDAAHIESGRVSGDDDLEDHDPFEDPEGSTSRTVFASQKTASLSMIQLLRVPEMRIPLLVMTFAMAAQQFSGINAVLYYSNKILGKTLPAFAPYVSLGITVVNAAMTFPPIFLIERNGRKFLMNVSIGGAFLSLIAVGYGLDTAQKTLASTAIITFVASFAIGMGPVPFVVISDVAPYYAVAALSSAALCINWIANFIVGLVFLPLRNFLAWGDPLREGRVFYVFATALAFFGVLFNMVYREQRERR